MSELAFRLRRLQARAIANEWPVFWIFRDRGPETGPVTLDQRRIFILPTRSGLMFGFTLLVMLLGSINYDNNLGFVLTFLLGGMSVVSILHTFRNLDKASLVPGQVKPVFAGQQACFPVCVDNRGARPRYALLLERDGKEVACTDIAGDEVGVLPLCVPAPRRGLLRAGAFTLCTRFPLGLFRAWTRLDLDMNCVVYPCPEAGAAPEPSTLNESGQGKNNARGTDDFGGFRAYRPGDSPRHIAWKAAAHEHGLLTKQFFGQAESTLWLDWNALSGMDGEARLSRLCRWVLDAHQAYRTYGLRLPGQVLDPCLGEAHRDACLRALALFDLDVHAL
ncbi:MAG: DUF58 domain-containing protein [Burkholderiales bacterium]